MEAANAFAEEFMNDYNRRFSKAPRQEFDVHREMDVDDDLDMATMVTPKILLLDEHTAALDPATAKKVLDLTRQIVAERKITCLMVTHNMHQALELGNRTLMMDSGNIILDVSGEKRAGMTVEDLLEQFAVCAGKRLDNDRILFSQAE